MRVVRRTAVNGVDLVSLVNEHLAEVAIPPGLGEFPGRPVGQLVVNITQSDDLEPGRRTLLDLTVSHATDTHATHAGRVAGSSISSVVRQRT